MILVANEQFLGSREQLNPLKCLSLPTGGDGREHSSLGRFVAKTQLVKVFIRFASKLRRFRNQVDLDINLG